MTEYPLQIEISKIDPNPFAARQIKDDDIAELALSLKSNGLLSPIKVRPKPGCNDRYEIIFGHRRLLAAKTLGWRTIRAEISNISDEQMLIFALNENMNRVDFTDYEKAKMLKKMREDYGWSLQKIAESLGKSISFVSQHLAMLDLFGNSSGEKTDEQEEIEILKNLTERHARALMRLPKIGDRIGIAKLVVVGKLGVRETEKLVNRMFTNSPVKKKSQKIKSQEIHSVIERLIDAYQRKSLSDLARLRHQRFSLFDDIPPLDERLNFGGTLNKTVCVLQNMTGLKLSAYDVRVDTFGNFGIATLFLQYSGFFCDVPLRTVSRVTVVLLRQMKEWKIVHEHWSPVHGGNEVKMKEILTTSSSASLSRFSPG